MAITGMNPATLDAARQEMGSNVLVLSADAGDVASQQVVAASVREAFGELDILVVNAGVADLRPIGQVDEANFDRSFSINLKGPYFLIQALLPFFANPASIVLNTSINAHLGMPNSSIYAASKAALLSLSRTLSGELISRGIRVNAINPGLIDTQVGRDVFTGDEQVYAETAKNVPIGRAGRAEEIAAAVLWLCSPGASYVVGQALTVDGGMTVP